MSFTPKNAASATADTADSALQDHKKENGSSAWWNSHHAVVFGHRRLDDKTSGQFELAKSLIEVTSDETPLKIVWDPDFSEASADTGDDYVHDRSRCQKTLTRGRRKLCSHRLPKARLIPSDGIPSTPPAGVPRGSA
jgi:hypothetical protein